MKKRRSKRFIRNSFIWISVIFAICVFVSCSLHFIVDDLLRTIALIVSGGYILAFLWANEV